MHHKHRVINRGILRHEYFLGAVGTAADWQICIFVCATAIKGDDGVDTESFVDAVLEERARFELGKCDGGRVARGVGPKVLDDGLSELLVVTRVLGKDEEEPG